MNKKIYHKDEPNFKSQLGIKENKIVEIKNFIDNSDCNKVVKYLNSISDEWTPLIGFYGTYGIFLMESDSRLENFGLPNNFFKQVKEKFKEQVESIFNIKVKESTSYVQIWKTGSFSSAHSDNSFIDGTPNNLRSNKFTTICYFNDDYLGGELFFPEHEIEISPRPGTFVCYPGGAENLHGVKEITSGARYSFGVFWDFEDASYPEEFNQKLNKELSIISTKVSEEKSKWKENGKFMPNSVVERMWRFFVIKRTHINSVDPIIIDNKIFYYPGIMGRPQDTVEKIYETDSIITEKDSVSKWKATENFDVKVKTVDESKYDTTIDKNKSVIDKIKATVEFCLDSSNININSENSIMSDLCIFEYSSGLVEKHKKNNSTTGILYLDKNTSITFPEYNLSISPEPGSVIVLCSNETFFHEVEQGKSIICPIYWYPQD